MVKIGGQKTRPNTLVSAASVRGRTLAGKVYCTTEFKYQSHHVLRNNVSRCLRRTMVRNYVQRDVDTRTHNRPFPPTFAICRNCQKLRYWVGFDFVLSVNAGERRSPSERSNPAFRVCIN